MEDEALRALLRDAERQRFCIAFADGAEMLAEVVSTSHVDADDTLVLLRVGAAADECAWRVALADIRAIATADCLCLIRRQLPNLADNHAEGKCIIVGCGDSLA